MEKSDKNHICLIPLIIQKKKKTVNSPQRVKLCENSHKQGFTLHRIFGFSCK